MANNFFRFKQFVINQENCAMKVGTDGCLLGAWANLEASHMILDIGCGSGLIAIMAAQRCPSATITGVEIEEGASQQARENAEASPWSNRIEIINSDFLSYFPNEKFDTIVSNPPYFVNSLKCPDSVRSKARHDDSLASDQLLSHARNLLTDDGRLSVVIPTDIYDKWCTEAKESGLYLSRTTYVHTRAGATPKRVLVEFSKAETECVTTHFTLEEAPGIFSAEATALLKDFYLKL